MYPAMPPDQPEAEDPPHVVVRGARCGAATELSMAWFNRLGIWTWSTRPTKDSTSDVMKMPLWARMIGMARRSHVWDRVRVDGGPRRLVAGHLGDRDELGARPRRWPGGRGRSGGGLIARAPPGQPVGAEGPPPRQQAVEGPLGLELVAEARGDVAQPGGDGGVGRVEGAPAGRGEDVVDLPAVGHHRCGARPGPGPPGRRPRR